MRQFVKDVKTSESKAFAQYKLSVSAGMIRVFAIILGVFNLLLLIPDLINMANPMSMLYVCILRGGAVAASVVLFAAVRKSKSFNKVALLLSVCELYCVIVFLYVFNLYENPNLTIQMMGMFIMILAFFVIPNRWINMLIVSILAAAGFIVSALLLLEGIMLSQLMAVAVYLGVEILLCAVFTLHFGHYQRNEYTAKTDLKRIYSTDQLTRIGNRVRLEDEADKWIAYCARHGVALSLMLVDIDNLKDVNDRYGHLIGDVILYEVAQIMHTQLRKNDVCTRWGGDEFVILLPSTDIDQALNVTGRIRQAITEKDFSIELPITCSFGITCMERGDDLEKLIRRADASMYAAKRGGKNRIHTGTQTSMQI